MGKISKRLIAIFSVAFIEPVLSLVFTTLFLFQNTAEQNNFYVKWVIVTWLIFLVIGNIIVYFVGKKDDRLLENLSQLSDQDLKKFSASMLDSPFRMTYFFIFMYLISNSIIFYIGSLAGVSIFTNSSFIAVTFASLIGFPGLVMFGTSNLLKNINHDVNIEVTRRSLVVHSKKVSVTNKMYFVFVSLILGLSLFINSMLYYFVITQAGNTKISEYENFQSYLKLNNELFNNENVDFNKLVVFANQISKSIHATVMLVQTDGKIAYQTEKIQFWNPVFEKKLKADLLQGKSGSLYENYYNNWITYTAINKEYNLVFVSNTNVLIDESSAYYYWSAFLYLISLSFVFSIVILFNRWFEFNIFQIKSLLGNVSKGDFRFLGGKISNDEMGDIIDEYNLMQIKISSLLKQIKVNSLSLSSSGVALSNTAQAISQGANEQSSTAEELSSTVEEILATVISNADKAGEASKVSQKISQEINDSAEVINNSIQLVKKISEKIGVIGEIAGKTDLLSINASIEAARSGNDGLGFAVVADEIKKLSAKTKTASDEINMLSQSGNNYSVEANEKLSALIDDVMLSMTTLYDLSESNIEQKKSMEDINSSVLELNTIINSNSSSSEEMATSAEELSAQAAQLDELLSSFKIEEDANNELLNEQFEEKEEHLSPIEESENKVNSVENTKENLIIKLDNDDLDSEFDRF